MHGLEIYIPIQPISANRARMVINGQIRLSPEARRYKKEIINSLYHNLILKNFAKNCDDYSLFEISIYSLIPRNKLYTKQNKISKTSSDIDNPVKLTQDAVYEALSYANKDCNDALIVLGKIGKLVSPNKKYGIFISIKKVPIDIDLNLSEDLIKFCRSPIVNVREIKKA